MTNRTKGIISAGHAETARAAAQMLRDGGNAIDAAVAGMFASCVAEPVLASLGGGGFAMVHPAGARTPVLFDFFAQTPLERAAGDGIDFREILADFGPVQQAFHIGAGATATPGFVQGLSQVHRELGRLPWPETLAPAIALARDGLETTPYQAYLFSVVGAILTASPEATALFAPSGDLLKAGDTFFNVALAETLSDLARDRDGPFADTSVGDALVTQSACAGGYLTRNDLTHYTVERREPLDVTWRDRSVFLNPAPAAGGALVGLGLAALGARATTATNLLDAMEAVNDARARFGGEPTSLAAHLSEACEHPSAPRGTTHISVIDQEGSAIAITVSNGEGNGLMLGDTGVMANNMLGEEDLFPDGLGRWAPNVRLSSMMAPTIVSEPDGSVTALGSGGSNRIRTALMQAMAYAADDGGCLETAIQAPRLHLEKNGTLSFEDFFSADERTSLLSRYPDAQAWRERNMFFGGVHAVRRSADGTLSGAGDQRRSGVVVLAD